MIVTPVQRRLLVVDPCDDCYELLPGLRAAGWEVDSCTLAAVGERSCDVGLLRLQPYHLERPEAVKELISRSQCLPGSVLPEHIASMALFLASQASAMCSAQNFIVDGGWV